ncbi:MAG: ATP-binding protein [Candidatus Rokubacteria bacterium]|nr:ATP-binding protein [Candidatus Rokubacteria bacterium]
MEFTSTLKALLRRLKLSPIAHTLPERIAYASKAKLGFAEFLELVFQDEVDRREQLNLERRLERAQFASEQTFEGFDWDAPVTFDRDRVKGLFNLGFMERKEDVIFMGQAGVGKTFLASALGHAACRAGTRVLFLRADVMLKELLASRADHSTEKAIRRLLAPDLLIVDDFGLRRLDATASCDMYEVLIERHKRASTIITANRSVEEWVPLFDDPLLANSALDRFAHNAHQIVIEGESYRKRQGPAAFNRAARSET